MWVGNNEIFITDFCDTKYYRSFKIVVLFIWNWIFQWSSKNSKNTYDKMNMGPVVTLKSTSVSVCFRGISRLPSAFVFLWWLKLEHISIQVCTFHDGCKQGINQQIFNRKSISRKIMHPQSWKLQAKLTGEKLIFLSESDFFVATSILDVSHC